MSSHDQQELLALGGWQGHDEFKKTVAAREDQRRADDGMGRAERHRARRCAKVFDGSGGMVVLHAELDQVSGERVKTALGAMNTKMLGDDISFDPVRTFDQRFLRSPRDRPLRRLLSPLLRPTPVSKHELHYGHV